MSFLYQALIKEKQGTKSAQNNGVNQQTAQSPGITAQSPGINAQSPNITAQSAGIPTDNIGQTPPLQSTHFSNVNPAQPVSFAMGAHSTPYAPEQSAKQHWFWLVIASLLAIVGGLGGYLFASQGQSDAVVSAAQSQAELAQQKQAQLEQHLAAAEQANQQLSAQLEDVKTSQQQPLATTTSTELTDESGTSTASEKQIEIAVGEDGQIKTQVSQLKGASNPDYSESAVLERSAANDVALDEIPEQLKSTFADAVRATENKPDPSLFSAQVNSGSSLPLLNEMDLSQVYWVPDIEYQMHIYASAPSERWIRINGKTLNQGDELMEGLTLLEIRQDQIIWQSKRRRFAQNALQDFVKTLK